MVATIFGFSPGQDLLPFGGLNEFLSAVLAARVLKDTLRPSQLAQIATCIEATIPFRPETAFDELHARLGRANAAFHLGMNDDELVDVVRRAVGLANRDVANFASTDRAMFLDNTWKLLPESNIPLRSHGNLYHIGEYQLALKNMEGFFANLNAEVVFHSFGGKPDDDTFRIMKSRAKRNVEVARKYLRAKLVATATIVALAQLTGGDGPVALFTGDLPDSSLPSGCSGPHLGDYLPDPRSAMLSANDIDEEVFELLAEGRKTESSFDLRNSPVSAFLYGLVGGKGIDNLLPLAKANPMSDEEATKFLDSLPPGAYYKIAVGCAQIAVTRAKKLTKLADTIYLSTGKLPPIEKPAVSNKVSRNKTTTF